MKFINLDSSLKHGKNFYHTFFLSMRVNFQPFIYYSFRGNNKPDFDTALSSAVEKFKNNQSEENKMALFELVEPKLQATSKGSNYYSQEDIYQEKVLALFQLMANIDEEKEPVKAIQDIINSKFHNKTTLKEQVGTISLDTKISDNNSNTIYNFVTEDSVQKSLSVPSEKQKRKAKEQVANLPSVPNFELVRQYFGLDGDKKTYKAIANENNVSKTTVYAKIKGSILEMQIQENCVPDDVKEYMEEFKKEILKGVVPDEDLDKTVASILISDIKIMQKPVSKRKENLLEVVKRFEKDGLTEKDYIKAAIERPQLFYQSPNTIEKNIRDLVEKFEKDGLTTKDYLQSVLKKPLLFSQSPDTIEKNIRDLVKKFENEGLTTKDYLQAVLERPTLFSQLSDTIEKNIRDLVKKFKNDGLTTKDYLQAAVEQPSLFYQLPDTISNNVYDTVNAFKHYDLTVADFIEKAIKMPQLFCLSPQKTVQKVNLVIYRRKCEAFAKNKTFARKPIKDYLSYTLHSEKSTYLKLLNTLMFKSINQTKIRENKLNKAMPEYLKKHSDETYNLQILDGKFAADFIKFAHNYSENILGKNVFNIEVINTDKQ